MKSNFFGKKIILEDWDFSLVLFNRYITLVRYVIENFFIVMLNIKFIYKILIFKYISNIKILM